MNAAAPDPLRQHAVAAVQRLRDAGHLAYWAGGCVRDTLLGRTPKDYDIATDARPDAVLALFPGAVAVGKSFGVVRVPLGGHWFEVATFRRDHAYLDGRHPAAVSFADPAADAQRRDFTINALFYDPLSDTVLDFVAGRRDLETRTVRCVGRPAERFAEDRLRLLRAVRFASTLDFAIEPETARAIREQAPGLAAVSAERIREELVRTLVEAARPGEALEQLYELGLLAVILPEVCALRGQAQPPEFHPEGDVWAHTVRLLNLLRRPDPRLALAALFHDLGKPATAAPGPDRLRFDGHDEVGAQLTARIMGRLRFAREEIDAVCHCVRRHMRFLDVQRMRRSTLRRLVGHPLFPLELELHRLDCLASHGQLANYEFLLAVQRELAAEPVLPAAWITGRDLLGLGLAPGPAVGYWKRKAYDAQLEGRFASPSALRAWLADEIRRAPAAGPEPPGAAPANPPGSG